MKLLVVLSVCCGVIAGCRDDGGPITTVPDTITEMDLFALGHDPAGFVFYKLSTDTIAKGGNSLHPDPKLRTRYNVIASRFLDAEGKVHPGTVFPDSSLIVKELYTDDILTTYVFMFKRPGDANADANGWLWAETSPTGAATFPLSRKGSGCSGCHSVGIDYTRMNDAHF